MLLGEAALRPSCGRALQIFPATTTDNILVIDKREHLCAVPFASLSTKRIVFT